MTPENCTIAKPLNAVHLSGIIDPLELSFNESRVSSQRAMDAARARVRRVFFTLRLFRGVA